MQIEKDSALVRRESRFRSRFRTLAGFLPAVFLIAGLSLPAIAQDRVNWRQFQGDAIFGMIYMTTSTEAWFRPLRNAFMDLTGIEVRFEVLTINKSRKKVDALLSGRDPTLDFFLVQMDNRGIKLTVSGHLENLEPYLEDPTLTSPDYAYPNDWAAGCLNTERVMEGQVLNNIVWSAQAQTLHYRKDLFEKYDVKVPTTLEELEEAAKLLTIDEDGDGKPELYGFLSRGRGRQVTASFATYLWNYGGSWIRRDDNGKRVANINSKEAIDAFLFYGRMLREYSPPQALNNKPRENAALFISGKVAMLSELNLFIYWMEDPRISRVVGKVGTILVPRGPAGSFPNLPTTSLAISPYSQKKKAAWLYIMWMTQKAQMQFGQNRGLPMCRSSVWKSASYKPPTKEWGESAQTALEYGIAIAKPQAMAIGPMRDAVAQVMDVALRDGSRAAVQKEADKQAAIMNKLIAETEKGLNIRGVFRAGAKKL